MEADKETKEILSEADHVKAMLDSDGWKFAHGKLVDKVMDLQNIHNLDMTDPNTINTQLAARKMAVAIISDWLQRDVYGFVEQQELNNQKEKPTEETFIERA